MRLVDRLSQQQKNVQGPEAEAPASMMGATAPRRRDDLADGSRRLKIRVHSRLLQTLDVSKLDALEPAMVSAKVTAAINETLDEDDRLLTEIDRARLVSEIKNELLGLGPLEPLLHDDAITDILVNGHSQVYVEKAGKLHRTDVSFQDDQHLMLIIDRIVSQVGRRVDEASPMVDARLRRFAHQRDYPAAGARWPIVVNPALRQAPL
jgi:pilus assembly protein CpaF